MRPSDRDHGARPPEIRKRTIILVPEVEGGAIGNGSPITGRLDDQIVKAPALGEAPHLLEEFLAQRDADATVRHLHRLLVCALELAIMPLQFGVEIHVARVLR